MRKINSTKGKNKKPAFAVCIVVEGETEENFLKTLKKVFQLRFKMDIIKKSKFKTLDELEKYILQKRGLSESDYIYYVYDVEMDINELKKLTIQENKKYFPKDRVFISNQYFETFIVSFFKKVVVLEKYEALKKQIDGELKVDYVKGANFNFEPLISGYVVDGDSKIEKKFLLDEKTPFSNVIDLIEILTSKKTDRYSR